MPKKAGQDKLKDDMKNLYSEYGDKVIRLLGEHFTKFIEEQAKNIVEWIKDLTRIKQVIRKYVIATIVALSALTVTLIGVSNILAMYFPGIALGWWQLIIGLVTLLIVAIYVKK